MGRPEIFFFRWSISTDFVKVAEAMGLKADRCIKPDDVENKLKWLLDTEGPVLLEIVVDKKVSFSRLLGTLFLLILKGRSLSYGTSRQGPPRDAGLRSR